MGKLKGKIQLFPAEEAELKWLVSKGKHLARKVNRAQILLRLHEGRKHADIVEAVGVSWATVYNVHDRYLAAKLKP